MGLKSACPLLIAVFADVEYLSGGQFCASRGAAGAEHVGRFVTVGVEGRRGDGAHAGLRQRCRLRGFGVHCEEETLRRQRHERGRSAVIEPNGVGCCAIGRAEGIYLHSFKRPGIERIEHHVLSIEWGTRVSRVFTGHIMSTAGLHGEM